MAHWPLIDSIQNEKKQYSLHTTSRGLDLPCLVSLSVLHYPAVLVCACATVQFLHVNIHDVVVQLLRMAVTQQQAHEYLYIVSLTGFMRILSVRVPGCQKLQMMT